MKGENDLIIISKILKVIFKKTGYGGLNELSTVTLRHLST